MSNNYSAILISMDWVFEASTSKKYSKNAAEFINKLSKKFILKLTTTKDEVMVAKWLIDNGAGSLIKCLVEEGDKFFLFLNDDCMKNCKDFDKLYKVIADIKD